MSALPPPGCGGLGPPACGCDGKYYGTGCLAHVARVDTDIEGTCPAPPGEFPCGNVFCAIAESYCERIVSDVGGVPDSYFCQPLPAPCNRSMSCACLAGVTCGDRCEEFVEGGMMVTCPGG